MYKNVTKLVTFILFKPFIYYKLDLEFQPELEITVSRDCVEEFKD